MTLALAKFGISYETSCYKEKLKKSVTWKLNNPYIIYSECWEKKS